LINALSAACGCLLFCHQIVKILSTRSRSPRQALEVGQRKLARQTGRRLLKESVSIAIAVGSLTNQIALQPLTVFTSVALRTRSREEQFDYIRRRRSALTPPCPFCRMRNCFSGTAESRPHWISTRKRTARKTV
jgi:hypothetical protein